MCDSDSGLSVSMNGSQLDTPCQSVIFIRLTSSEFELDKILNFAPNTRIIDVKLSALELVTQDLKDKWNFGLFLPPSKGKAGKFLQEDRTLKDYPFQNSVGHLELKYKQRVYRLLKTNANKLRKLHTKQNLRQFLDCVKSNDLEKVNKWLNRGLDPNFQSRETGNTPLTLAVMLQKPREMVMALVAGGAHLDYRALSTMTPLHQAAAVGNLEAIRVLLDLGQSPNTRDQFNLTPLYYAVLNNASAACVESLLNDCATLGTSDEAGLQEIHQACRFGRVQHLELLIFYGADINSQTSKNKNTPLHICAFTGQESCARMLLFRGAERTLVNRAGHTAYQQAVLSDYPAIAELINNFQAKDVVPLRDRPKRNRRRRSSLLMQGTQNRCASLGRLNGYSPDERCCVRSQSGNEQAHHQSCSLYANSSVSNSVSGYCLDSMIARLPNDRNHGGTDQGQTQNRVLSQSTYQLNNPVNMNHCQPNYAATMKDRTKENRYLPEESNLKNHRNFFNPEHQTDVPSLDAMWMSGHEGTSDTASIFSEAPSLPGQPVNSFVSSASALQLLLNRDASILDLDTSDLPRMVVLQKGPRGFGFVVRGRRGVPGEFQPTLEMPALQYLEKIEPNSAAELAGLKTGDYILEVNGTNVSTMSHEAVVQLIRGSGDILGLKVITVNLERLQECSTLGSQSLRGFGKLSSSNSATPEPRRLNPTQEKCQSDQTNLRTPANARTASSSVNNYQPVQSQNDPYATLSKRTSGYSTVNDTFPAKQSNSFNVPTSCQPAVKSKPLVPPTPKSRGNLAVLMDKWKPAAEDNSNCSPTVFSSSTNGTCGSNTNSEAPLNRIKNEATSENTTAVFIPPPPPANFKKLTECTSSLKSNPNNTSLFPNSCHVPDNKPSTASFRKSGSACSSPNVDEIDDQLPLPPPPPEVDPVKNSASPTGEHSSLMHSILRHVDRYKEPQQAREDNLTTFTDHLRKALELRRQRLELQSNEDDEEIQSRLDVKVPATSTLYTNSRNDETNHAVKSTFTMGRSSSFSKPSESAFKSVAEKFQSGAMPQTSSATLPPPDNFKDDHSNSSNDKHTLKNEQSFISSLRTASSVVNSMSTPTATNGISRDGISSYNLQKRPNGTASIPPPPPIVTNKPLAKFKTGL